MSMEEYESHPREEEGYEDFEKEDDKADWQFPLKAVNAPSWQRIYP